jgi:hypothetical protein
LRGEKVVFGWSQKEDWRKSPAHLLLLTKFLNGDSPAKYRDAEYWEKALKENPVKVIDQFHKERMLEPAGLRELVNYKFKTSDLKLMLREKSLKVSGRKEEIIQRLIEYDERSMRDATNDLDLYRCTAEGIQLAEHYLESEKAKRVEAERDVLVHLERGEFSKAVRIVSQYEASQVFPRGLGVDWENYDVDSSVDSLKSIFERVPGILKDVEENRLNKLRMAAAMMHLWGTNTSRNLIPDDFETGIRLDVDAACRMFVFHAYHLRDIARYREAGVQSIEVSSVCDGDTCAECQKINEKKYKLESVPELPYPKCTCDIGCRCTTIVSEFR